MKNFLKPLGILFTSFVLFISGVSIAFGVPVSVPSAPGNGYMLTSTSTGAWISTTTEPLHVGTIYASSTSATSTFANGIIVSGGCIYINGTCLVGGGSVTSIGTTWPITGGTITTTGTLGFNGLATTSPWTAGQVAMVVNGNTISGVSTSTLTATSPLTGSFTQLGSGGSLGCQTASGAQAGCLSSTDWTTFNNKQATISATWPITLSGATVGFNGLATTTTWTAGQLAYVVNGNTVTSVATSTLTAGTGLTGSFTQVGSGGSLALSTPVSIANGGTNATSFTASNGIVAYDGTKLTNFSGYTLTSTGITLVNATTTNLYVSGNLIATSTDGFAGIVPGVKYFAMRDATTTTWTTTTTAPYISNFALPFAGTLRSARCYTDASYLNVDFYINSTHLPLIVGVNPTAALTAFFSNNTFVVGDKLYMSAGTTTTATTKDVECTLTATQTQ